MKQPKWPSKIEKVSITLGNLVGYAWQDRWHENIWFEANGKLYVPRQFEQLFKKVPFDKQLNILFKITYGGTAVRDLVYNRNPLLEVLSQDLTNGTPYLPALIYGVK